MPAVGADMEAATTPLPDASMDSEDDTPKPTCTKRSRAHSPDRATSITATQDHQPPTHLWVKASFLLRPTNGRRPFGNPSRVSQILDNSPLAPYILDGDTRSLGNGASLIIAVWEHHLPNIPLLQQNIFNIGECEVTCRRAERGGSDIKYAKIGPIDEDSNLDELIRDFRVLEGTPAVEEISWIPTHHLPRSTTAGWLRLKVRGQLPTKVSIGRIVYHPYPYLLPLLRCPCCLRIGHSSNTCHSPRRCSRCSGPHPYKQGESTCSQPFHCFQCGGGHGPRSPSCPHNQEAQSLYTDLASQGMPLEDINRNLRGLQMQKRKPSQPTLPRHLSTTPSIPVQPGVSFAAITTRNRFSALQDHQGEDDRETSSDISVPPEASSITPRTIPRRINRPKPPRQQRPPPQHSQSLPTLAPHPEQNQTPAGEFTPQSQHQQNCPTTTATPSSSVTTAVPTTLTPHTTHTVAPRPSPPTRSLRPHTPSHLTPLPGSRSSTPNTGGEGLLAKIFSILCEGYHLYQQGTPFLDALVFLWPSISSLLSPLLQ